jgi:hypothetical protein
MAFSVRFLTPGRSEPLVKGGAVAALNALLELCVDVHRHRRVSVPDLAHDPT